MANDKLTQAVLGLLGPGSDAKDVPGGKKFSLDFSSFDLEGPGSSRYRFPAGSVALVYDAASGRVGNPFVEGEYSHPVLAELGSADQPVSVLDSQMVGMPLERRIARTLDVARKCLAKSHEQGYTMHDLDSGLFEEYRIA